MGNAGRVLMIPKGDYNPATPYEMLDCVYYNGRSYVCKQASTGHAPTDTTYWQVMTPDASAEIQALTNYVAENNVKNLFDNTATTETTHGVTSTANADRSVTVVGTLTANYLVKNLGTFHGKAGKQYLVSGGISSTKYVEVYNTTVGIDVKDVGSGITFTPSTDADFSVVIVVSGNGATFNDTFYPMIRLASITDSSYQPYAKTNVELTQDLPQIESGTTAFTDGNEKVNFSKAFSTAPNVIAIPKYTTVTTGETPLLLKVYDVTTTYFRVCAIDNTGANVSSFTNATSFMWQAMT